MSYLLKLHTKIYLKAFGFGEQDFIPSEISGSRAVDIHHILRRGMGYSGSSLDRIENLMALTREEHEYYGDKKQHINFLLETHKKVLTLRGISFDENWFNEISNKNS